MQNPVLAEISPLTLGVLLAFLLALALSAVVAYRRTEYTLAQAPLYLVNLLLTRVQWRASVQGRLPIPSGQGAVIVSNHIIGVDPLFIALATNRPVHWIVATEYYSHWAAGWAFRILQAIPVSRGGIDTAATKLAVRGLTTESIGAPSTGMSNWYASIDHEIDTSSGSRVRRLGTMAMSSNA